MKNYFTASEFACKCGCGLNNINQLFIEDLNTARHLAGIPFVITSGTRCPAHNKRSGGLANSSHVSGLAADIRAKDAQERFKVIQALIQLGFNRIGVSKHFIHVDCDTTKPANVMWTY